MNEVDHKDIEYPVKNINFKDVMSADVVIGVYLDGTTEVLKNRYGKITCSDEASKDFLNNRGKLKNIVCLRSLDAFNIVQEKYDQLRDGLKQLA
jgi:hypothetical protein